MGSIRLISKPAFRGDGQRVGGSDDPLQRWLAHAALGVLALCAITAVVLKIRGLSGLLAYYFYAQDSTLLLTAAAALWLMSRVRWSAGAPFFMTGSFATFLIALSVILTYAGAHIVMEHYPLSRDEAHAEFAASYLGRGQLGWPIPAGDHAIAKALMPVWTDSWLASGYWVTGYLPINSALRALTGYLGDTWLAGPLLLAIGLAALWSIARRLWPDSREPATVVLILALTSSQLLANAMTPYATTGHFALNTLWIACFLRGGRWGHGAAVAIGLLATGLHQYHFHLLFLSGFIVWAWLSGRRRIALLYFSAAIAYVGVWRALYPYGIMVAALGPMPVVAPSTHQATFFAVVIGRIGELEPFSSFARFVAWQNILLLPLVCLGLVRLRSRGKALPIAVAFQISCFVGMAIMVYQGFGYGYRYLNGTMPCFLLLAGGGWVRLGAIRGQRVPGALLMVAAGFALIVTLPFALLRSHALLAPYAAAFRTARAAPADIVLVDGRGGGFLQDIVRIDTAVDRPLLLDLAYVPPNVLYRLCRTRRVMLFDGKQAGPLGIQGSGRGDTTDYPRRAEANRSNLAKWRCDTPVQLLR